jgi:alpha-beta hydrolase superfamily lysophospholipase
MSYVRGERSRGSSHWWYAHRATGISNATTRAIRSQRISSLNNPDPLTGALAQKLHADMRGLARAAQHDLRALANSDLPQHIQRAEEDRIISETRARATQQNRTHLTTDSCARGD